MRPVTQEVVGAVEGTPITLDWYVTPFQVSVAVQAASGSISATLQYTYDDPLLGDYTTWWDHPLMTSVTADTDVVLNAGPVTAVRVVNADTGTVKVQVIQAGRAVG